MRHAKPVVSTTCIAMALLVTGRLQAQPTVAKQESVCQRVLSSKGARVSIPSLTSPAIREAVCACLATTGNVTPEGSSENLAGEWIVSALKQCIAVAAPAERMAAMPVALAGVLDDLYNGASKVKNYTPPKVDLSACKRPEYPAAALKSNAVGTTVLNFQIGADGKVLDGEIQQSAGRTPAQKLLDVTALFSLMQCGFEPARWRGQPIESWSEVAYRWKIE